VEADEDASVEVLETTRGRPKASDLLTAEAIVALPLEFPRS
jgi:hypothetical protein